MKSNGIFLIAVFSVVLFSGCGGKSEDTKTTNTTPASKAAPSPESTRSDAGAQSGTNSTPPTANKQVAQEKPPANYPKPVIGTGADDMFMLTQVRSALSVDPELLNSVVVDVKAGNTVLNGKVSNTSQRSKAEQIAKSVKGVKSVKNNLSVQK